MQNLIAMNVLQAHAYLYEKFPYFLLLKQLLILCFEEASQVTVVTVLHCDIEHIVFDEGLLISYNIGVDQLPHYGGFVNGLLQSIFTLLRAFSLSLPNVICFRTHTSLVALLSVLKIIP